MEADLIDPGIAAKTASGSFAYRFHATASRHPNALMTLLTVENRGLPSPARALYRLSLFCPASS
ncbi:MAG: hypothetical protein WGN25_09225 [Candidatus Electrothrix sp. GW3-4]|uniref:hypothetical protein n=1 Tax=Candidatus Electrothrix sp. GW3-4 TaxID=3126740 RepID=UPI0030D0F33E